jgi:hypothetical protein
MKILTTIWIGFTALLVSFALPANSQTMSFGDAVGVWVVACGSDVDQHCKGIKPGGGQLTKCLAGKASPICQQATSAFIANMDTRFAAQKEAQRICRNDVQRLCSNFRKGRARVLRCLMRKDNFRAASRPCKNTLQTAGWLDTISKSAN